jgi:hypothetical protein
LLDCDLSTIEGIREFAASVERTTPTSTSSSTT